MIIAADKEVGELKRGLHFKLVLIMLLLIASLMTVVGVFLVRGVKQYYLNQFYSQMSSAFSDPDFADALTTAASEEKGETLIDEILLAYAGSLGINSSSRYYYVLDKNTAGVLAPSTAIDTRLEITPNMITAMTGEPGDNGDIGAAYMDVAMPIGDKEHSYIIYIKDNKHTVQELNNELFQ
ncbi:MAG: cell wall metabolism sensor histidine kinase WalK, partial [Clostridiales bacterium]|nr:cell wall metabolism sensor histidine kinase WalK [Clostridiales bacterium]